MERVRERLGMLRKRSNTPPFRPTTPLHALDCVKQGLVQALGHAKHTGTRNRGRRIVY